MKCPNCNQEIEDRDVCPNCRYEIQNESNNVGRDLIERFNVLSDVVLAIGILLGIIFGICVFFAIKDIFEPFITSLLSIVMACLICVSAYYKALILRGEAEKIKLLQK